MTGATVQRWLLATMVGLYLGVTLTASLLYLRSAPPTYYCATYTEHSTICMTEPQWKSYVNKQAAPLPQKVSKTAQAVEVVQ